MQNKKSIHFLLRYSDSLKKVNTFKEHKNIEELKGYTWYGKFGNGASNEKVLLAKKQITKKKNTYLYLATEGQIKHRANILDIFSVGARTNTKAPERSHVPKYYRNDLCSIWLKINNLKSVSAKERELLYLYNSPYSRPQMTGMCSLNYVICGSSKGQKPIYEKKSSTTDIADDMLECFNDEEEDFYPDY
jgi:hypothetical protein